MQQKPIQREGKGTIDKVKTIIERVKKGRKYRYRSEKNRRKKEERKESFKLQFLALLGTAEQPYQGHTLKKLKFKREIVLTSLKCQFCGNLASILFGLKTRKKVFFSLSIFFWFAERIQRQQQSQDQKGPHVGPRAEERRQLLPLPTPPKSVSSNLVARRIEIKRKKK